MEIGDVFITRTGSLEVVRKIGSEYVISNLLQFDNDETFEPNLREVFYTELKEEVSLV